MTTFLHSLIFRNAEKHPEAPALLFKDTCWNYAELAMQVTQVAKGLSEAGLERSQRVGVYLPKTLETATTIFATCAAGGAIVPVNPLLKGPQVQYILKDCNVKILVTQAQRLKLIKDELLHCSELHTVYCVDTPPFTHIGHIQVLSWSESFANCDQNQLPPGPATDGDMAAILYTSGSTGNPKGVVLSHRNMVVGAESVSSYLQNTSEDRILAVLPFSFDYGLSQLTTAFNVGASAVLMDYLLPNDIVKAIDKYQITGLAAVPPLWAQLTKLDWPSGAGSSIRYFTNSGGAMPEATLKKLREIFTSASPYLMYGLTEAFRSTYLPPDQVDLRPTSMGKAIPNSEIYVVRPDGSECADNEPGELVHCGPLVSLGYWNDPAKTEIRYKPDPLRSKEIPLPTMAVWSGDTVYRDNKGYLYFVGRADDMIKTSGYRVSPTEVEEQIYASGLAIEAAAIGIPHPDLGQAVVIVATPKDPDRVDTLEQQLIKHCQKHLPNYMVPKRIVAQAAMPHNANGKIDRKTLVQENKTLFSTE